MRQTKKLLALLNESYPPDEGRRHGVMLGDGGELEIQLALNGQFQPVVIAGNSLDASAVEAFAEVDELLRELPK